MSSLEELSRARVQILDKAGVVGRFGTALSLSAPTIKDVRIEKINIRTHGRLIRLPIFDMWIPVSVLFRMVGFNWWCFVCVEA